MTEIIKRLFPFFSLIALLLACEDKDNFSFNYNTILNREFRYNIGRLIPVAYESAVETDGVISNDGNYMYYASNRGNAGFDIYIRDLRDITVARITEHPAKDTEPDISPDGKSLVFASNREDPEGDIYLLKINPKSIIKKEKQSVSGGAALDNKAVNLTKLLDSSGSVKPVKDSNPVWSPDGKSIAFVSKRDGMENIWLMDGKGKNITQITKLGGLYPRFSPDGGKIIFISYREPGSMGDIYIKDISRGTETKVIGGSGIKLFPSFMETDKKIIYTLISSDTDRDGKLSLTDRGLIMYYDMSTGDSYPLTLPSENSFNARWIMIAKPWAQSHDGLLVFSDVQNNNINVNIIPGYGIIPKKIKASYQYTLALSYDEEYGDAERYKLALKRIYYFFGSKKDNDSQIYTARAMNTLWNVYKKEGNKQAAAETEALMSKIAQGGNIYVKAQYDRMLAGNNTKRAETGLKSIIQQTGMDKSNDVFMPYLEEDLAKLYIEQGKNAEALSLLTDIKNTYPKYEELASVHMEYALLADTKLSSTLSDSAVFTLESGRNVQKVRMNNHFISLFEKEKNLNKKITLLDSLLETYKDKKRVSTLLYYLKAITLKEAGLKEEMLVALASSAEKSSINDLMYYKANLMLGTTWSTSDMLIAEKYMAIAVNNYKRYFEDSTYKQQVTWLIDYYEENGEANTAIQKYDEAVLLYSRYKKLIKYIFDNKYFPAMYNIYAPRAHVLYADAVHLLNKDEGVKILEAEYKKDLFDARMESDKAYIYGLAYIYTKKAMINEDEPVDMFEAFAQAIENTDWALFIDSSFIDPYILKSWIYQYADMRRAEDNTKVTGIINRYFPERLWEANIPLLEKALMENNEAENPEHEGNIHLNIANNYFLLVNYPRALTHYQMVEQYKTNFESKINHALFRFHFAYCYWQNDELDKARSEMESADYLFQTIATEQNMATYAWQFYTIYKYYALFSRMEGDYEKAIEEYRRILSFTSKYNIKIDRARYYQEIAWCYQALGRYDEAAETLALVDKLLDKYPKEKEPTYKFTVRNFYLLKWQALDIGVDNAVNGNNKIFTELNVRNKRLLNLAMSEEIQAKNSDYSSAIKFLEQKIQYLEKRDNFVDKETLIITYNNLGYYNAMNGNYYKATEWFNKAWKQADEDNFLDGSFTAIMNLTNMYVSILERDSREIEDGRGLLSDLSNRIIDFRESYQSELIAAGTESLKNKAKKQNRKVTPEETKALEQNAAAKAKEVYYKADIALGVLKYYMAELKRNSMQQTGDAQAIYAAHSNLYNEYNEALNKFNDVLSLAREREDTLLVIKMLLNVGNCYARIGAADEAYAAFLDAKDNAEEVKSAPLIFRCAAALGLFLQEQGAVVEGREAVSLSASNLMQAVDCIKESPLMYAGVRETAARVYNGLVDAALSLRQWDRAFTVDEEHSAFKRAMLVSLHAGELHSAEHRKNYAACANASLDLHQAYRAFERGDGNDDTISKCREKIKKTFLDSDFSASYISANALPFSKVKGVPVVRFIKKGSVTHVWTLKNGNLKHFEAYGDLNAVKTAANAIGKNSACIIFNETAYNMFKANRLVFLGINGVFVTSLRQVTGEGSIMMNTLYNADNEPSVYKDLPIAVTNDAFTLGSPIGYDIIADKIDSPVFNENYLFANRLNTAALITTILKDNFDYLFNAAEAASISGINAAALLYPVANNEASKRQDAGVQTVKTILEKGTSSLLAKGDVICFGKNIKRKLSSDSDARSIYGAYKTALAAGRLVDAESELVRWHNIVDYSLANEKLYAGNRIALFLEQQNIEAAEAFCTAGLKVSPEEQAAYMAWIKLYTGDIAGAENLLKACATVKDYKPLKATADISAGGNLSQPIKAIREYAESPELEFCIPRKNMLILAAGYLRLAGEKTEAGRLLSYAGEIYSGSNRDIAFMTDMPAANKFAAKALERQSNIKSIINEYKAKKLSFYALLNSIDIADTSKLSRAIMILLATGGVASEDAEFFNEFASSDMLSEVRNTSYWLDMLVLDMELVDFLNAAGEYSSALDMLSNIDDDNVPVCIKKQIITKKSLALLSMKRYKEAYDGAAAHEALISRDDANYMEFQLFLLNIETSSTSLDAGKSRVNKLLERSSITASEKFILRLFEARIELKHIAKIHKPTENDGKLFHRIYMDAVDIADKNSRMSWPAGGREIFTEIADAYINFRLGIGDILSAAAHLEIKKQILAKLDLGMERRGFARFNPKAIQKYLDANSVVLYIARNGNDAVLWTITGESFTAATVEDCVTSLSSAKDGYKDAALRFADTSSVAEKIGGIFAGAKSNISKAATVYIAADEFMESLPLEIAESGKGNKIFQGKNIFFLSSLQAVLGGLPVNTFALMPQGTGAGIAASIERTAISESGIKITDVAKTNSNDVFVHLYSPVTAGSNGKPEYNANDYASAVRGSFGVYLRMPAFSEGEFALYSGWIGARVCIINNAAVQDLNIGYLLNKFYGGLAAGQGLQNSFAAAKLYVAGKPEFKHPAYQGYVRLYLN